MWVREGGGEEGEEESEGTGGREGKAGVGVDEAYRWVPCV